MNKKSNKEREIEAAKAARLIKERLNIIDEFNRQYMGDMWIDARKTPTEEDVKQAQDDINNLNADFQARTYLIADAENAKHVAEFLQKFMSTCFWTQNYYIGVRNFAKYIKDFLADYEKEPIELRMDFGTMQFCSIMLTNFAGFGIEAADRMAEMTGEYEPIRDIFKSHVDSWQEAVSEGKRLQLRLQYMAQGFYVVDLLKKAQESAAKEAATDVQAPEAEPEAPSEGDAPLDVQAPEAEPEVPSEGEAPLDEGLDKEAECDAEDNEPGDDAADIDAEDNEPGDDAADVDDVFSDSDDPVDGNTKE